MMIFIRIFFGMDTVTPGTIIFNPAFPTLMHIDLNSCFATIEQQANPHLRGKPIVVAAYTSARGCVLTASREAKSMGIDTGMRVSEAQAICPWVGILPSDPEKYRFINRRLRLLLSSYTSDTEVKSIDEMVLNFQHTPSLQSKTMEGIAREIKQRIRQEIGEWLTVSVGISTNRYLAKIASNLQKPDGLTTITSENIIHILSRMPLEKLTGIKSGYGARLRSCNISTALDFYRAPPEILQHAFHSVIGYHWWLRLHGWEADDRIFARRSFGQSYALYKPHTAADRQLAQITRQLVEKMARRMRQNGFSAGSVHVNILFADSGFWHAGKKFPAPVFASRDLYSAIQKILTTAPVKPVRILAVSAGFLSSSQSDQMTLFGDQKRLRNLTAALDSITHRFGGGTVIPASMLGMEHKVLDRISFGSVKEIAEYIAT